MTKKALVIGGGVAGCACAFFLSEKKWKVTIIEASDGLGGMSRTKYFNGHPYEFGPHLWFWPHDDINDLVRHFTNDELLQVERKLVSYSGGKLMRYPLHWADIRDREDFEIIREELVRYRHNDGLLIKEKLPVIGECTFREYFEATVGPTLYREFMADYTHKMWGIDGDTLTTKMVWADRIKSAYTDEPYDPIKGEIHEKLETHGLGEGLKNWYPKAGWNPVWEGMAAKATVFLNTKVKGVFRDHIWVTDNNKNRCYKTVGFDVVIWTIHTDAVKATPLLGGQSRVVLPLVFPGRIELPKDTESIHLSDRAPATRITDMSIITGVESPGFLYLFELPGVIAKPGAEAYVNQWYEPRCYNHLSTNDMELNWELSADLLRKVPNIHFCGRAAEFQYYGMPQTVDSARRLCEDL